MKNSGLQRSLFEWVLLPCGLALSLSFLIWTIGAFAFWNIGWMSLFGFRVVAVISWVVTLAILVDAETGDSNE